MTAATTLSWDQPGAQIRSGIKPTVLMQESITLSPSTMSARSTASGLTAAYLMYICALSRQTRFAGGWLVRIPSLFGSGPVQGQIGAHNRNS